MVIFPLAPDQTIAQMWSNGARGGAPVYPDCLRWTAVLRKRIDWPQKRISIYYENATIVTTTVHHCSSCHKHQTCAPHLWDINWYQWFTEIRRVRKSWLVATSHHGSRRNIPPIILNDDWWGYQKFFVLCEKMKSTASVGTDATFSRTNQARWSLPPLCVPTLLLTTSCSRTQTRKCTTVGRGCIWHDVVSTWCRKSQDSCINIVFLYY